MARNPLNATQAAVLQAALKDLADVLHDTLTAPQPLDRIPGSPNIAEALAGAGRGLHRVAEVLERVFPPPPPAPALPPPIPGVPF